VFQGGLPWGMVGIGAAVGAAIIAVDLRLEARGSSFRAPVLAVAVGIYLPIELAVPILVGGLVAAAARRYNERHHPGEATERHMRGGMLFAAGLITGEALIGIFMAVPIVVSGEADVLALPPAMRLGSMAGLAVVGFLALALYRIAARRA
jgi:putative OPT family oligopeptide transporter